MLNDGVLQFLPPRKGYVEVEVDGVRRYRSVDTGLLLEDEPPEPTTAEILNALLGVSDHE